VPNEFPPSRFLADLPEELIDWRRRESSTSTLRGGWGSGFGTRSSTGEHQPRERRDPLPSTGASFGSATPRAEVPSLVVGDRVTHDSYGLGTVVAIEGSGQNAVAKVDFGSAGTKRLLLRFSPVTKL
jgi:DNA helicase-2/ATP-dependent DNA helicase PcrA